MSSFAARQPVRNAIVATLRAHEQAGGQHFDGDYPFDRDWRGRMGRELADAIYTSPTEIELWEVYRAIRELDSAGIVSTRHRAIMPQVHDPAGFVLWHDMEVVLGDFDEPGHSTPGRRTTPRLHGHAHPA